MPACTFYASCDMDSIDDIGRYITAHCESFDDGAKVHSSDPAF